MSMVGKSSAASTPMTIHAEMWREHDRFRMFAFELQHPGRRSTISDREEQVLC